MLLTSDIKPFLDFAHNHPYFTLYIIFFIIFSVWFVVKVIKTKF